MILTYGYFSHAPLPCEADKGWQEGMAGDLSAVMHSLWVDASD